MTPRGLFDDNDPVVPKIGALAPWFGGKRNLAPLIVRELGPHSAYWEPFCGSMAVLLAKPPATMETVNDLHGDLINLARVIKDGILGSQLYRRLRRVLMTEDAFDAADGELRSNGELCDELTGEAALNRAENYFLASWLGRNGTAGMSLGRKGTYCVRFTRNGGHAATRFRSAVASIPAWRRRLANVTILRRDGFELLGRIEDDPKTAIYCDPPYLKKGAKYLHDFKTEDHRRLAELLCRFRLARVVVSYYDDPQLAELYQGWTQTRIDVSKAMSASAGRNANEARAVEILLVNGESHGDEAAISGLGDKNERSIPRV